MGQLPLKVSLLPLQVLQLVLASPVHLLQFLDVRPGLVEQPQCGVSAAVRPQRDEGLEPLQTHTEMGSSVGEREARPGGSSASVDFLVRFVCLL